MYIVVFFLTLVIWIAVKYGTKVQVDNINLWPLQNFVEITLVILVVILAAYAFTFVDTKKTKETVDAFRQPMAPGSVQPNASDVHTFRDLISEYYVDVGHRPSMNELTAKVYGDHKQFMATHPGTANSANSTVGVFISGPVTLKRSTENAVSAIGIRYFDVHEEEFDL